MIFKFLGGAREVGRSAIFLKDEANIMLDYGIKLDHTTEYPVSMPDVDAIIISHAHLDHSGFLPAFYQYKSMPLYGTMPTLELSELLLNDALSIAKKQHSNAHYSKRDISHMKSVYVPLAYEQRMPFGKYDIEFYDAGHITGSAITLIERANASENKRIVYTGDFKLASQTLHGGAKVVPSDVLITESTYEGREHIDRDALIKKFVEEVKETLDNGGTALVPAFAVGRSQELLAILYQNNLAPYVYMDGMCKEATRIVAKNPKFITNADVLSKAIEASNTVDTLNERKKMMDEPRILLTTAGMLNGGPVLQYISKLNKNSRIFITGYQIKGTNGRLLVENGYIIKDGRKEKISTPLSVYDFSAHAGNSDLHEYVRRSSPNIVICVHGDEDSTTHFAEELNNEGFEAYAPKIGESIKLSD